MARILIVPGLSVRSYVTAPATTLVRRGHSVSLLAAPAWRRTRTDLAEYGRLLAADLAERAERVDLLVGLSVGTQAAALAAASSDRIARMLLVSPTVDPKYRSLPKLLNRWVRGDSDGPNDQPSVKVHVTDWAKAGPSRIAAGLVSALRIPLEDVLPNVSAETTLVHAEHDVLSTEPWARSLAVDDAHFRFMSGAPHSWPVYDGDRFAAVVEELLA